MKTSIGDNSLLMAYVHIAHDCTIGKYCVLANNANLAGHVEVGDHTILGGATNFSQYTKIGRHVIVSGGCLVNKDIPPFVRAARHPTTYAGVNSIGLRRRGYTTDQINQILEVYRTLFIRGYNTSTALKIIEAEIPASPDKDEIVNFVQESVRGIMKGFKSSSEE